VGTAAPGCSSRARQSLLLWRHRQPENRNLARSSNIKTTGLVRIRQIERLTMFAAIDFRIAAPSLLHITANLLQGIGSVEPAFKVTAAKLAFLVLLVASPLSRLLKFDFVFGKLRRSLRARGYGCGQKVHPRSSGQRRRILRLSVFYSKGFARCQRLAKRLTNVTRAKAALFACTLPPSVVPLGAFGAAKGRTSDRGTLPSAV
jgi:hypothetical protein